MRKILTAAIALSFLASAGAASAQPRSQQRPDARYEQQRGFGHDDRTDQRGGYRQDNRYERRSDRQYQAGRYNAPRGYQGHQYRRGERLPSSYRSNAYRVDARRYGLSAPPRGYEYVRVGNDAVLTAVATGIIASVIISLFQ